MYKRPRQNIITHMMKDSSEIVDYDQNGIPLYIETESLSFYEQMRSSPHWHDDLEIMYIHSGTLNYHVNKHTIPLKTNECVLVNARQIHYSTSIPGQDATFTCILFHPSLLSSSKVIYQKYFQKVIENSDFEYMMFSSGNKFHKQFTDLVLWIVEQKASEEPGYELRIVGRLLYMWNCLFIESKYNSNYFLESDVSDIKAFQNMVSFIRNHYIERITLEDIASAGNICRSKCCAMFKKYIEQSPVAFLNEYRLVQSEVLLTQSSLNITDISYSCGFSQPGYFCKAFKKVYGLSPLEYRKGKVE